MNVASERPIPVVYKQTKLECGFRLDLLVEDTIIVELKSVPAIAPVHEATILTYLRLSGHTLGLLINFNVAILKDGIRRYIETVPRALNTECAKIAAPRAQRL
jgi:GxxExxY protein